MTAFGRLVVAILYALSVEGLGHVDRKEYQLRLDPQIFSPHRFVGIAKVHKTLRKLVSKHHDCDVELLDIQGRPSHFVLEAFDTPDFRFRNNGIVIRIKTFKERLRPKYYVVFKVNSIDPDTLWPPLSNPTKEYEKKSFQKLEQDLHQHYTKFAQSTTVRTTQQPVFKTVRDLMPYVKDVTFDWIDWDQPLVVIERNYVWRNTDMKVQFGGSVGQIVAEVYYPDSPSQTPAMAELSMRIGSKDVRATRAAHRLFQLILQSKLNHESEVKCAMNIGPHQWPVSKLTKKKKKKLKSGPKNVAALRKIARKWLKQPVTIFMVLCAFGAAARWWFMRRGTRSFPATLNPYSLPVDSSKQIV